MKRRIKRPRKCHAVPYSDAERLVHHKAWMDHAASFGLDPDLYGRFFTAVGKTWQICGLFISPKLRADYVVTGERYDPASGEYERFRFSIPTVMNNLLPIPDHDDDD